MELIAAVVQLAFLFSGCVANDAYIGTYKLDEIPSKTLESRADGTHLLVLDDISNLPKTGSTLDTAPL